MLLTTVTQIFHIGGNIWYLGKVGFVKRWTFVKIKALSSRNTIYYLEMRIIFPCITFMFDFSDFANMIHHRVLSYNHVYIVQGLYHMGHYYFVHNTNLLPMDNVCICDSFYSNYRISFQLKCIHRHDIIISIAQFYTCVIPLYC